MKILQERRQAMDVKELEIILMEQIKAMKLIRNEPEQIAFLHELVELYKVLSL